MKQSKIQYLKPVIENIDYKINDITKEALEKNEPVPVKTTIDVKKNDGENKAIVKLNFYAPSTDFFPYHIDITMSSQVKWENTEDTNNMIDNILNHNVPAMILSYMRPIISTITSHSDYQSFDIPFLDLRNDEQK